MSRPLFEEENNQNNFVSLPCSNKNIQKKPKSKFTILDDLDQLNEIINGPGANQQSQKAQQVLQKTYQYMKPQQQSHQHHKETKNIKTTHNPKQFQQNQSHLGSDDKQNNNKINIDDDLQSKLKLIKAPRIIITSKKIDLTKQPTSSQFYVKGLENLISSQQSCGGTRAPRNSMLQNGKFQDGYLFTKALQTERNRNGMSSQNIKMHRHAPHMKK